MLIEVQVSSVGQIAPADAAGTEERLKMTCQHVDNRFSDPVISLCSGEVHSDSENKYCADHELMEAWSVAKRGVRLTAGQLDDILFWSRECDDWADALMPFEIIVPNGEFQVEAIAMNEKKKSTRVDLPAHFGTMTLTPEQKEEAEKAQREKKRKEEARTKIERAQAHLEDYAVRLEADGMKQMAAEVRDAKQGADSAIMLLGFAVAYNVKYQFDGRWEKT